MISTETRIYLAMAIAVVLASFLGFCTPSHGQWATCDAAYEFCAQHRSHRNCREWTQQHKPLVLWTWRMIQNPAYVTEFCKENPWHIACGSRGKASEERIAQECPMPEARP